MLNLTAELLAAWEEHKDVAYSVAVTLANGETFTITEDDIVSANILRSDPGDAFPLGYVYCSQLTLSLFDTYSDIDFFNAVVVVNGVYQYNNNTLNFQLGEYTITEPTRHGELIEIVGYDRIYRADTVCQLGSSFPIDATDLFELCCVMCGINYDTTKTAGGIRCFPSDWNTCNIQFSTLPEGMTYRQVMGMVAMLFGANAYISPFDNYIYVVSPKYNDTGQDQSYDGGSFDPWNTVASLNGGSFNPWNTGDSANGGVFPDAGLLLSDALPTPTVSSSMLTIGGVKITSGSIEYVYGSGYLLTLDNSFITGQEQTCVDYIGQHIAGYRFMPLTADIASFPFLDLMLCVTVDVNGKKYRTTVTNIDNTLKGITVIKCNAKEPIRNSLQYGSSGVRSIAERAEATAQQAMLDLSLYDLQVQRMSELIANAFGAFMTKEVTQGGGVIYYMHDKPQLSQSQKIWRYTVNGFTVSVDGGTTYTAGMDAYGNAILNVLSAIGISADWIKTGSISSNNGGSYWNLDNGTFVNYYSFDQTRTAITMWNGEIGFHSDLPPTNNYYQYRIGYIVVYPTNFQTYIFGELRTFYQGGINIFAPNILLGTEYRVDENSAETKYYPTIVIQKATDLEVQQDNKYRLELYGPTYIRDKLRWHDGNASSVVYMPEIGIMNGLNEYNGASAVSPAVYAQDVFCLAAKRIWIGNTLNTTDVNKGISAAQPQQNYYCTVKGSMRVVGNFRCYGFIGNSNNVTITKDTSLLSGGSRHNLSGIETCSANLFSGGGVSVSGTVDCNLIQYYQQFQKSDSRLKDIKEWDERYDGLISELHPILYSWKTGSDETIVGLSAQEVEAALKRHEIDDSGIVRIYQGEYSLDYTSINMLLLKHVQDQNKKIKELENRLEQLETIVNTLLNGGH